MGPRNDDDHGENQGSDSPPGGEPATSKGGGLAAGPSVIGTNDPVIESGGSFDSEWKKKVPDSTMVVKTNRIQEANEGSIPGLVMVPVEFAQTPHDRADAEKGKEDANGKGKDKSRDERKRPNGDAKNADSKSERRHHDRDRSDNHDHDADDRRQPARPPSLTRMLLFSALVASVCGLVGAWGYSYFFVSSKSDDQKSSGDQKTSNKKSGSSDSSDSSKKDSGSKSGGDSGSKSGAGSNPKSGGESASKADSRTDVRLAGRTFSPLCWGVTQALRRQVQKV